MKNYLELCKPKVVLLMLITAWSGMFLALQQKNFNYNIYFKIITSSIGITLACFAAAVFNQIIDRHVDGKMTRTKFRPLVSGKISLNQATIFGFILGLIGFLILYYGVNKKTAYLTIITSVGYAGIYTGFLKRLTPQNIVIGGLTGAMPPILGWVSITNNLSEFAWLLVAIIFAWTPPHFWALAIYRYDDYVSANIPMLPVTHGINFTRLFIFLYAIILFIASLLPFICQYCGYFYLTVILILNFLFLKHSLELLLIKNNIQAIKFKAKKIFVLSIFYLGYLFLGLIVDQVI